MQRLWDHRRTQEHVINEYTGIHNQESKVQLQEIFDENTEQLKGKGEKNRSYNGKAYQELQRGNATR